MPDPRLPHFVGAADQPGELDHVGVLGPVGQSRRGGTQVTRGKVVTSRWPDPAHGGVHLGFPTMR